MNAFLLPVATLWQRELIHFWRERSRVLGFVGTPLLFWLIIGSGFGNLAFFFPGALTLAVMFSAIFSMMSLIEDRREGFLLSMLASPAPRSAMAVGKIAGSATLAWLQSLIFLAFLPAAGFSISALIVLQLSAMLFLIAFAFTALGFFFAWHMDSTQGFHAVMNLVLFPLWMVSGSLFSFDSAGAWMRFVMKVNPLTYSVSAIRRLLEPSSAAPTPPLGLSVMVTAACAVVFLAASTIATARPSARSRA
jgi:ABC-2 type transport system permease protein